jgi:hypothetical protein
MKPDTGVRQNIHRRIMHQVQFRFGVCLHPINDQIVPPGLITDMAAKRHKIHKNKISGLVKSMCYNEQKLKF